MKNKIKYFFILVFCCFAVNVFAETESLLSLQNEAKLQELKAEKTLTTSVQMAMSNPDYLVTPGDIYSLNYAAGTTPVSYAISVDTTYKIRVSNLAVLDAKGKTFVELKKEVENIVTKNYPLSGVQFVLMSPATFTVVVKGEVKKTEERSAWALSRLSSVVSDVYTDYSSNRFAILKRADGTVKKCDLFLASRFGDLSQDPYLCPGDVIEIPRLEKRVTISGAVERPGTYDLTNDEDLFDLISYYANGLTSFSDLSRVEITKVPAKMNVKGDKIYIKAESLEDELLNNYSLENFDSVYISSYKDLQPVVFIEGAIRTLDEIVEMETNASTKISLPYVVGENYSSFLRSNKDIFYADSDTENAYVVRNGEVFSIDINKSLYDATYYSDLYLEENDTIVVPFKQMYVTVIGAVNAPGRYAYIPDRTYDYYVGLAGGFDTERNNSGAVKIVDVSGKKQDKNDVIMPEDTIAAKTNSVYYYTQRYSSLLTTILALVTTVIAIFGV